MTIPYYQGSHIQTVYEPTALDGFPTDVQKWIVSSIRAATLRQGFSARPGLKVGTALESLGFSRDKEGYVCTRVMRLLPEGYNDPDAPKYWETTYFHCTGEHYTISGFSAYFDPYHITDVFLENNQWHALDLLTPHFKDYASRLNDLHMDGIDPPWDPRSEAQHHWINGITSSPSVGINAACKSFLVQITLKHIKSLGVGFRHHFYQTLKAHVDLSLFRHLGAGLYYSSPPMHGSALADNLDTRPALALSDGQGNLSPFSFEPNHVLCDPRFLPTDRAFLLPRDERIVSVCNTDETTDVFVSVTQNTSLVTNLSNHRGWDTITPHTLLWALSAGKPVSCPVSQIQVEDGFTRHTQSISADHTLHWFTSSSTPKITALIQNTATSSFIGGFHGAWGQDSARHLLTLSSWIGTPQGPATLFGDILAHTLTHPSYIPKGVDSFEICAAWCGRSYLIPHTILQSKAGKRKPDEDADIGGVLLHTDSSIHWPPLLEGFGPKFLQDNGWFSFDPDRLKALKRMPKYKHATLICTSDHPSG
jgi:hypothetical protein